MGIFRRTLDFMRSNPVDFHRFSCNPIGIPLISPSIYIYNLIIYLFIYIYSIHIFIYNIHTSHTKRFQSWGATFCAQLYIPLLVSLTAHSYPHKNMRFIAKFQILDSKNHHFPDVLRVQSWFLMVPHVAPCLIK